MSNPVPNEIKELRGTLQECRRVPNEPKPPRGSLDAPDWLTDRQRELWREVVEACPVDLLRPVDLPILTQFVIASDLYREAAKDVAANGYKTKSHRGASVVAPAVHVLNQQAVTIRQCIQELGFSPASRTRINTLADAGGVGDISDDWSQLALIP